MVSLHAFPIHGFVTAIVNVLMAVMKIWKCVVSISIFIRFPNKYSIVSATWDCDDEKFTCGIGLPRCILQTRTCNNLIDCSDGKDEDAELCGKYVNRCTQSAVRVSPNLSNLPTQFSS